MSALASLVRRLRHAHPDHFAIAQSMTWVALFVVLGYLARAAKEMAIAYRYGVSAQVDAYLFVFNLVTWPVGVWFSVLTVVLVPLAARLRQEAAADLPEFRSELFGLTLAAGLALGLLLWLGLPLLLGSSWTGLSPASLNLALGTVPALAILAPFGLLISLFSAWMLAAGHHANTLLEGVPAVVVLMAVMCFSGSGVEPLVWGTVIGFAFHLASLAMALRRSGELDEPRFTQHVPEWPVFWQAFGVMLIGQALMGVGTMVDQFYAAHLGTGAIASLGYANRLLVMVLGLGATVVSRATLPAFSRVQAQGGQLLRVATQWTGLVFLLGGFAALLIWWLAPWVVKLLFERGAFTALDSQFVTEVLRYGLPQLPFYFSGLVLVSVLASRRKYRLISTVGALNLLVKILANAALTPLFGVAGLMLANSVMLAASFLFLIFAIYRTTR